MDFEYYSTVTKGKLQKNVQQKFDLELNNFENERVHIILKKLRSTRTSQQNRYLHLLFGIFSKELIEYTGDDMYTPEMIKDLCKMKFLVHEVIDHQSGEVIGKRIKHTSKLSKSEFSDFVAEIKQWAMEQFNIYLPEPGEQMEMEVE